MALCSYVEQVGVVAHEGGSSSPGDADDEGTDEGRRWRVPTRPHASCTSVVLACKEQQQVIETGEGVGGEGVGELVLGCSGSE